MDRRLARPPLALADAARAAPRDRPLPPAARRSRGRSELGGVALLQRAVARPAPLGVHLVHRRRARSAAAPIGGAARCSSRCTSRDGPRAASRARVASSAVRFSTTDADLRIGDVDASTVLPDGRYARPRRARERRARGTPLTLDLVVTPRRGAYFPGATLTSGIVSGYVVPALRAEASGSICVAGAVRALRRARRRITITTGACGAASPGSGARRARAQYTFLYGRVEPAGQRRRGAAAVRLPRGLARLPRALPPARHRVRGRAHDARGRASRSARRRARRWSTSAATTRCASSCRSRTRRRPTRAAPPSSAARGSPAARSTRPYFVQMKGTATISGRIRGTPLAGSGAGFFETYR